MELISASVIRYVRMYKVLLSQVHMVVQYNKCIQLPVGVGEGGGKGA